MSVKRASVFNSFTFHVVLLGSDEAMASC